MLVTERTSASTPAHSGERKPRITVAQLFLRAVRRWQHRRATNALLRLDDGLLKDIGIARGEIPRVVESLIGPEYVGARCMPKAANTDETRRRAA